MRRSVVKSYFAALLFTAFADPVAATRKKPWKEKIYMPKCAATSAFDATALGVNTSADAFTAKYDCETGASGESICWEKEADFNSGDTAWMLTATTFVMLQTPAAGFAQAGLVRRKNAMSVIGQAFMGVVIGCIMWYAIGYSLTFGSSCNRNGCGSYDLLNETSGEMEETAINGFIGDLTDYYFFNNVLSHDCAGLTIPHTLFATFQMTFALMVPVLVTGAWAEKFKFSSACLFMIIWPVLVYYPTAHWIWGGGFMSGWNGDVGVLDYAGGIVIHTSSGVSAFVVAKMLQKRKDFKDLPDTTHNLPLTMVGVALVWVGWYSFNGGSGLAANGQAAGALLVTQISSCFAAMTWAILSKLEDGRVQVTHIASGALCGLAGITPGSGFLMPVAGVPVGIIVGLSGWYGGKLVKSVVKLDDVLDVTSLQAFPGAVGSILVGFFATTDALPCAAPVFQGKACGRGDNTNMGIMYGGNGELLGFQTLAVFIMVVWAAFFTWITMLIIKSITGLDVDPDQEKIGLDITDHGEKAYDIDGENDETDDRIKVGELCERAKAGDLDGVRQVITKMGLHPSKGDVDGRTGLHIAARYGQLEVVQMLVEEFKVDVNVSDNKGQTPLMDAHAAQSDVVTNYLISKGASQQTFSNAHVTKMLGAAASGDVATVNQYMQGRMDANAHDYDSRTALHLAAAGGHETVVKLLLNAGADVKKQDRWGGLAVHDSKRHGHHNVTRLLALAADGKYEQQTIDLSAAAPRAAPKQQDAATNAATLEVLAAAANGDVDELKRLKKKGANLACTDYDGRAALHQAAQFGHLDAIKFLVGEKKINVNVQDNDHHTPLNDAVANGHGAAADFLKLAGATMVTKEGELNTLANEGKTAELKSRIVDGGVDANTADYDGRTAIHLAAATGNVEMIQMLADSGANVNVTDRFGGSPLDDAIRSKQLTARDLLIKLGASVQGKGKGKGGGGGGVSSGVAGSKQTVQTMV